LKKDSRTAEGNFCEGRVRWDGFFYFQHLLLQEKTVIKMCIRINILATAIAASLTVPVTANEIDVLAACKAAWNEAKDTNGNVDPLAVDSTKCVTVYQEGKTWGGYTLLSTISLTGSPADAKTHLIGMDGKRVKTWPLSPFPAKMLPNGNVIAGLDYADPSFSGNPHQENACLVEMDWDDRIIWPRNTGVGDECVLPGSLPIPFDTEDSDPRGRPTARVHHDFQREGNPVGYYAPGQEAKRNGKMLILGHANPPLAMTTSVSNVWSLEDDPIYEVSSNGNKILWRWDPYQHIDRMGFDKAAREAIRLKKVSIPGVTTLEHDWLHINDANYLGANKWCQDLKRPDCDQRFHPDNIIMDSREANFMAIIARHDHPAGNWKEGDIVWRVGPNFGPDNPESAIGQLIGMHHAHMIPAGLPGAGNILVFDNGGMAGYGLSSTLDPACKNDPISSPTQCLSNGNKLRSSSRVVEFDPRTLTVVWEYTQPNPELTPPFTTFPTPATPCTKPSGGDFRFFSFFIGSAQRLPNGNTLIDEGASGRVFEVTADKKVVWEFVNPFGNEMVGGPLGPGCTLGATSGQTGNIVYRAYRVPADWVPKKFRQEIPGQAVRDCEKPPVPRPSDGIRYSGLRRQPPELRHDCSRS
jgi:hypothetical protein